MNDTKRQEPQANDTSSKPVYSTPHLKKLSADQTLGDAVPDGALLNNNDGTYTAGS